MKLIPSAARGVAVALARAPQPHRQAAGARKREDLAHPVERARAVDPAHHARRPAPGLDALEPVGWQRRHTLSRWKTTEGMWRITYMIGRHLAGT